MLGANKPQPLCPEISDARPNSLELTFQAFSLEVFSFCCPVAQWQSRWLLTTWSLVRIQPGQPLLSPQLLGTRLEWPSGSELKYLLAL